MSVPDDSIARGFEQAFGDPEFAAKARKASQAPAAPA
jgi:hypothetical protein